MNADEYCCLSGIRGNCTLFGCELDVTVTQEEHRKFLCLQLGPQAAGKGKRDIFFIGGGAETRTQIEAAMCRVNHYQERFRLHSRRDGPRRGWHSWCWSKHRSWNRCCRFS